MNAERRRAPRYQFVAEAELVETASGTKSHGKTGDLSLGGCFLDTLNPAPEGTELLVTISRADRRFSALGRVVFQFPRLGMGVVFTQVESDQLAVLEEWLFAAERNRSVGQVIGATLGEGEKS
jgi:PilZ domain-containing protein